MEWGEVVIMSRPAHRRLADLRFDWPNHPRIFGDRHLVGMTDGAWTTDRPAAGCPGIEEKVMNDWQAVSTGIAVAVALASLLALLLQRTKSDLDVIFAVVSGSMALSLLWPWLSHAPAWALWLAAIGGSATCNGFWLLSRSLFRGEGGVGKVHVLVAGGVAALIALYRGTSATMAGALAPLAFGLDGLLTLASSTLLVLTFLEPLRGTWSSLPRAEQRLRIAFMVLFASCVLTTTLLGAMAQSSPGLAQVRGVAIPLCATVMIVFTHGMLRQRRRAPPVVVGLSPLSGEKRVPGAADARLAKALAHQLDTLQVYREPDLKVADLARRIGVAEHKLSQFISKGLGEKNFNQLLNRHRIAYACKRLAELDDDANILAISADAGFGSLGPFNRAFKSVVGVAPSVFRASCRAKPLADKVIDNTIPVPTATASRRRAHSLSEGGQSLATRR